MDSFRSYMLREAYRNLEKLGDRLAKPDKRIDWEKFRPIIKGTYRNDTEIGGRPNLDEVTMVKLLVIQQWYTLSDPELERQVADRLSFQRFLGFPEQPPDYSTVWKFRERLEETGKIREIWGELQRQLDEKGLKVKKGVIQDAAIMGADPGPSNKPRGGHALTRGSRDGGWVKRGKVSRFGYKLHVKTGVEHGLVRDLEVTSASVHDSRVDLSEPGEVVYRDKGYFGVEPRGWDATMRRGVRGRPLGDVDRGRNRRIGSKRRCIERTFAVIKRVFGVERVVVSTVPRFRVKMFFSCLCFDLLQLGTLGVA